MTRLVHHLVNITLPFIILEHFASASRNLPQDSIQGFEFESKENSEFEVPFADHVFDYEFNQESSSYPLYSPSLDLESCSFDSKINGQSVVMPFTAQTESNVPFLSDFANDNSETDYSNSTFLLFGPTSNDNSVEEPANRTSSITEPAFLSSASDLSQNQEVEKARHVQEQHIQPISISSADLLFASSKLSEQQTKPIRISGADLVFTSYELPKQQNHFSQQQRGISSADLLFNSSESRIHTSNDSRSDEVIHNVPRHEFRQDEVENLVTTNARPQANQIPIELEEDPIAKSFAECVRSGLATQTVYETLVVGMLYFTGLPSPACMKIYQNSPQVSMGDLINVFRTIIAMYRRRENMFPYSLAGKDFSNFTAMLIRYQWKLFLYVHPSTVQLHYQILAQTVNENLNKHDEHEAHRILASTLAVYGYVNVSMPDGLAIANALLSYQKRLQCLDFFSTVVHHFGHDILASVNYELPLIDAVTYFAHFMKRTYNTINFAPAYLGFPNLAFPNQTNYRILDPLPAQAQVNPVIDSDAPTTTNTTSNFVDAEKSTGNLISRKRTRDTSEDVDKEHEEQPAKRTKSNSGGRLYTAVLSDSVNEKFSEVAKTELDVFKSTGALLLLFLSRCKPSLKITGTHKSIGNRRTIFYFLKESVKEYRRQEHLFPYDLKRPDLDAYLIETIEKYADYFKSLNYSTLFKILEREFEKSLTRNASFSDAAADALLIDALKSKGRQPKDVEHAQLIAMKLLLGKKAGKSGTSEGFKNSVKAHFETNNPNGDHISNLSYYDAVTYFVHFSKNTPEI
jgi:hypothetical protein